MSKCNACMQALRNQINITCEVCKQKFHGKCVNMGEKDVVSLVKGNKKWMCIPCEKEKTANASYEVALATDSPTNSQIVNLINELRNELKNDFKSLENSLGGSLESAYERIDDLNKVIQEQSTKLDIFSEKISDLITENKLLKKQVHDLQERLDDAEQYSRVNTVEIHGIPASPMENLVEIVQQVGKGLDVEINEANIDACHRLGKGKENSPPGIIVRFVHRKIKEDLIKRRKVKANFSTVHIGLPEARSIYINESLCPGRRRVFSAARVAKREKNYKYLWVRNGNILIRKEDGTSVIKLMSLEDVEKL